MGPLVGLHAGATAAVPRDTVVRAAFVLGGHLLAINDHVEHPAVTGLGRDLHRVLIAQVYGARRPGRG